VTKNCLPPARVAGPVRRAMLGVALPSISTPPRRAVEAPAGLLFISSITSRFAVVNHVILPQSRGGSKSSTSLGVRIRLSNALSPRKGTD